VNIACDSDIRKIEATLDWLYQFANGPGRIKPSDASQSGLLCLGSIHGMPGIMIRW
jgi:hypothetical protein